MLEIYEKLLKQVDNRARFLCCVLTGDIQCINRKKHELLQELVKKGFDPLPKEGQPVVIGATGVKEDIGERPNADATDYDYLTKMSASSLTGEYLGHLLVLKKRLETKAGFLRKAAPQYLKAEKKTALLDTNYKKAQSDRDVLVDMAAKDSHVFEAAPRRQHKRTADDSLEESAMLMDDDDEEEEAPELKYQSKEHTETESAQEQETKRQRRHRKKQRKESSGTDTPIHCCHHALDFGGHEKSGDGFLVEEINKRMASEIVITHYNRDQSIVDLELAKLSLRDASLSLCQKGL